MEKSLPLLKGSITPSEKKVISELLNNDETQRFLSDLKFSTLKYQAAMQETETKIKILNDDFKMRYKRSPIEQIETRIKNPESLLKKMVRNKVPFEIDKLESSIFDIAGVRIICSFISDIYNLKEMIEKNQEIEVIRVKDYVENPKPSGYRSLHMIIKVPVYLTTGKELVPVEVQIRTMGMDFWASLEHKIQYKCDGVIPDDVSEELHSCAKSITETDNKMMILNEFMNQFNENLDIL